MKTGKNIYLYLIAAGVFFLMLVLLYSKSFRKNTLKAGVFTTYTVDRGAVNATIGATGVVESESEVLILSPTSSIIEKILKEPGNHVKAGEPILRLNPEPIQMEIDRLKDQLEMIRNNLEKTKLNSQSTRLDLDYNEEVKNLRIKSLKSQLADQQQLLEVGGISPAKIEETKQEIVLAEKDLAMLKQKNNIRLQQLVAEEKGLVLQIRMDEKELDEKNKTIEKLNICAPSSGIVLSISGQEGEKVGVDKLLVRMSDLSSFKIAGSIEEKKANFLKTGNPVIVKIENESLTGTIGTITPQVENNNIRFNVHLNQNNHPKLIVNQKADIEIINESVSNVLRIRNFEGLIPNMASTVLVLKNDMAMVKGIQTGLMGEDYCEIISGLSEGDVVILQDPSKYRKNSQVEIEK